MGAQQHWLHRVARLRPADALQSLVIAFLLVFIETGLRTIRVERVARLLRVKFMETEDTEHEGRSTLLSENERRWTRNATRVVRRWPLDATCLRRSLLLGWILRRREPQLIVGVRKRNDKIEAHAWIRLAGVDLDPEADQFLPFDGRL